MRSEVRDAFSRHGSKMKIIDIIGTEKQNLLIDVKNDLNSNLGKKGFKFDMISIIGRVRVDPNVQRSINAVIQATQRAIEAENKVKQSTAEAQQKIEKARGDAGAITQIASAQAEANRVLTSSLTPALIQWQKLQNEKSAIENWDGKLNGVYGGQFVPFIGTATGK